MHNIIIDNEFFKLKLPTSSGLISGLKKLSQNGFDISVRNFDLSSDETLKHILEIEGIKISNSQQKDDNMFVITAGKSPHKNSIAVRDKTEINNFAKAVELIISRIRSSSKFRKTKETEIKINLSLDGKGIADISTGIGFFDHMIEQIAKHSNINLKVEVKGDLHVDEHHTIEDVGITLGQALSEALGDKLGIKRYGYFLPMDDTIARCAIDLGGRSYLNFKCKFEREKVGEFPTELTEEFFRGLSAGLKANIFIRAKGKNDHHKIEAIFKAFAKSLNEACRLDERNEGTLPSTKGVL
ncbi:MAG TPA: imidazoleglycerol-phosphate dehydratase HisB [Ignavibacteriaceae bacterium]|nr:imidazoleglycerol-phosphate dehydratase HisB [Ignavibacteriaceae bacterium]